MITMINMINIIIYHDHHDHHPLSSYHVNGGLASALTSLLSSSNVIIINFHANHHIVNGETSVLMLKVKRFNVERAVERPTVLHPEVNHRQHQHGVGDDLGDCGITIHHPEFHHFGDGDGDDNDVGNGVDDDVGDDLGDCGITIHRPEFHHYGDGDGDDNDLDDCGTLPHGSAVKVDHQPLAWVEGN